MPAPKKTFYFDLETSGLDPLIHGILQLACIVDIGGVVVEKRVWKMRPAKGLKADPQALAVNGFTMEQIRSFMPEEEFLTEFVEFLDTYVNKYVKTDKFYPAGYNIQFDVGFLKALFIRNGHKYYGGYFNYRFLDPLPWLIMEEWNGDFQAADLKLGTVCEIYDIPLVDAHDAETDIEATRTLVLTLMRKYKSRLGGDEKPSAGMVIDWKKAKEFSEKARKSNE